MPPPADGLASRLFLGPALRTQPDRRLVTLVREGYETAFEEIVRRYGAPLRRYAAAIVGGHAEDVTQDSFSKALLALRRDGAEIELRPWLYRIVRNTALNDLRDRPREAEALAAAIAAGRDPAEEVEQREELAELMTRLRALPEPQRAAIVMRELEGLGHEEIAAALGISGGGARQAIHRARTALRNGVGMLLPLPLLRALIDHGSEAVAAGAGASGAAAAAGGAIGGAGAGTALKAGVVTAVLASSVGAGVALQEDRGQRGGSAEAATASAPVPGAAASHPAPAPSGGGSSGSGPSVEATQGGDTEDDRGAGEGRGGRNPADTDTTHGGPGHGGDDADDGGGRGPGGSRDHSGPGPSGDDARHDDRGGPRSGPGDGSLSGDRGGQDGGGGSSGPGGGSGSGHRRSGGGGEDGGDVQAPPPAPPAEGTPEGEGSSSGPGSGRDDGGDYPPP